MKRIKIKKCFLFGIILIFFGLLIPVFSQANEGDLLWTKTFLSGGNARFVSAIADDSGVFALGNGSPWEEESEPLVKLKKLRRLDGYLWSDTDHQVDNSFDYEPWYNNNPANDIAVDVSGVYIATGTMSTNWQPHAWRVQKRSLNDFSSFDWNVTIPETIQFEQVPKAIAADDTGVYIAGDLVNKPNPFPCDDCRPYYSTVRLEKRDKNDGHQIWQQIISTAFETRFSDMKLIPTGTYAGIYIVGYTMGDLDKGDSTPRFFLDKWNLDGTHSTSSSWPITSPAESYLPYAIDIGPSGGMYVVANINGSYQIEKRNPLGAKVWRRNTSSAMYDVVYQKGYVYVVGGGNGNWTMEKWDINSISTIWQRNLRNTTGDDAARCLTFDTDSSGFYVVGDDHDVFPETYILPHPVLRIDHYDMLPSNLKICRSNCNNPSNPTPLTGNIPMRMTDSPLPLKACYNSSTLCDRSLGDVTSDISTYWVPDKYTPGDPVQLSYTNPNLMAPIQLGQKYIEASYPHIVSAPNPLPLVSAGFTVDVISPPCVSNCDNKTEYCEGITYTDNCGTVDACIGTKDCSPEKTIQWREVSPE